MTKPNNDMWRNIAEGGFKIVQTLMFFVISMMWNDIKDMRTELREYNTRISHVEGRMQLSKEAKGGELMVKK